MLKKILLSLLAIIAIFVLGVFIFVQVSWNKKYDWPGPDLKVSTDSAVIARGDYLVNGPAHCRSCHVSSFADLVASDKGENVQLKGGVGIPLGPLGTIFTKNLTPDTKTGIGRYTDEQVFRMMRHGIKPDGTATLNVMMPFWNMADEDLVAIVSYLRSLQPVENEVPDPKWTFMGKAVRSISSVFKPVENPQAPAVAPPMAPTVERGKYLAHYVANCVGCHTPRNPETFEAIGPEFSGGMEFEPWPEFHKFLGADPELWLRTPNITPGTGSVMSRFKTPEEFIARFRAGRVIQFSPMDWGPFSRMSDEDITAIWMYLNSLEPVNKDVGDITFRKEKK